MTTKRALQLIELNPTLMKRIEDMAEAAILEAHGESPTDMLSRDLDNAVYMPTEDIFRVLHRTHNEHLQIDFDAIAEYFLPRSAQSSPWPYRSVSSVVDLDW